MSRHQTLDGIRARHRREERRLVLGALERCGWRLTMTAQQLDVTISTLQHLIADHGLQDLYRDHRHPRGRPKKA